MWKSIHFLFTIALFFAGTSLGHAQDAGKIIDQFEKTSGGSRVNSKVQTILLDGTITSTSDGKSGTYTVRLKQPNRYYSEIRGEGKTLIESYNGKSAWHQTESGEITTLLGAEALQTEAAGEYYNSRLRNLSKKKIGVIFKGHGQVRGRDALQLELTYPTGLQWEVFLDPQSHLVVEEKATIAGIPQ